MREFQGKWGRCVGLWPLTVVAACLSGPAWAGAAYYPPPSTKCLDAFAKYSPTISIPNVAFSPSKEPSLYTLDQAQICIMSGTLTKSVPTTGDGSRAPINGTGNSVVQFEMRLPAPWNGHFVFHGGGGMDGFVSGAVGTLNLRDTSGDTALRRGYAVVSMDSGHHPDINLWDAAFKGTSQYDKYTAFGNDALQRKDFAYQAIGNVTDTAKAIIAAYYGRQTDKSYFVGCSNGGRQAFMAATRFPEKFDGVLAGAPAINIAKQSIQAAWDAKQLYPLVAGTNNKPWNVISPANMTFVANKIRSICDGLDGAYDGMVSDVEACQGALTKAGFPANMACPPGQTANCLAPQKVAALTAMMGGPRSTYDNIQLYSDWAWDPGMETSGTASISSWRSWRIGSDIGFGYPLATVVGAGVLAQVANATPDPSMGGFGGTSLGAWNYLVNRYDLGYWNVDNRMNTVGYSTDGIQFGKPYDELNVPTPENLTAFAQKRGVMIVYAGSGDPSVSVNDTINWYKKLKAYDPNYKDYSRLYVVPGMTHCGGGPATDLFDLFTPLETWVDSIKPNTPATAPSDALYDNRRVIASLNPLNLDLPSVYEWNRDRKRPLCEYPHVPRYKGPPLPFTNYISADNFVCED